GPASYRMALINIRHSDTYYYDTNPVGAGFPQNARGRLTALQYIPTATIRMSTAACVLGHADQRADHPGVGRPGEGGGGLPVRRVEPADQRSGGRRNLGPELCLRWLREPDAAERDGGLGAVDVAEYRSGNQSGGESALRCERQSRLPAESPLPDLLRRGEPRGGRLGIQRSVQLLFLQWIEPAGVGDDRVHGDICVLRPARRAAGDLQPAVHDDQRSAVHEPDSGGDGWLFREQVGVPQYGERRRGG